MTREPTSLCLIDCLGGVVCVPHSLVWVYQCRFSDFLVKFLFWSFVLRFERGHTLLWLRRCHYDELYADFVDYRRRAVMRKGKRQVWRTEGGWMCAVFLMAIP